MRFLLGAFIFLSSSTLWGEIYLVCDASYIFYPDYKKRITFVLKNYEKTHNVRVIEYYEFDNVFTRDETLLFIKPYLMFSADYSIDRETGILTEKGIGEKISRKCKEYDSKSWDKEVKKQEDWLTKQLKKRKF